MANTNKAPCERIAMELVLPRRPDIPATLKFGGGPGGPTESVPAAEAEVIAAVLVADGHRDSERAEAPLDTLRRAIGSVSERSLRSYVSRLRGLGLPLELPSSRPAILRLWFRTDRVHLVVTGTSPNEYLGARRVRSRGSRLTLRAESLLVIERLDEVLLYGDLNEARASLGLAFLDPSYLEPRLAPEYRTEVSLRLRKHRANYFMQIGETKQALREVRFAKKRASRIGSAEWMVELMCIEHASHRIAGRDAIALRLARELRALAVGQQVRDDVLAAAFGSTLASDLELSDPGDAIAVAVHAANVAERAGNRVRFVESHIRIAQAAIDAGDSAVAARSLDVASACDDALPRWLTSWTLRQRSRAHGTSDEALRYALRAWEIAWDAGQKAELGRIRPLIVTESAELNPTVRAQLAYRDWSGRTR